MKTVHISREELEKHTPDMPNFVIWNWMIKGLDLKGTQLMLFAYIYSQSFDNTHLCRTSLTVMSKWFGLTRQALANNINKMPFIIKEVSQEHNGSGFYTFNYYKVDTHSLLQHCISVGNGVYDDFMLSYKQIMELKFPEDTQQIDDFFGNIMDWHKCSDKDNMDKIQAVATLGDKVQNDPTSYVESVFMDAITNILNRIQVGNILDKQYVNTDITTNCSGVTTSPSVTATKTVAQPITPTPTTTTKTTAKKGSRIPLNLVNTKPTTQKKTKAERLNEHKLQCLTYLSAFITENCGNNTALESLLVKYLDVRLSKGLTFDQWSIMLDKLKRNSIDVPDMISKVENAVVRNYMDLDYSDTTKSNKPIKKTATIESLLNIIDEFVVNYGECNEELKEVLYNYAEDVAYINGVSVAQFKQLLNNLHRNCPQLQDKLISVQDAFAGGWKSFVPVSTHNNKFGTQNNVVVAVDMDKKMECIDNYISYSYWYQHPNIKKLLVRYINETCSGKGMTLRQFKDALMYLRLHSPQANDVERGVSEAIMKDTKYLCREDFKDTAQANKAYNSLEDRAHNMERNRRAECEKLKKADPNNPIVANLELPKELDLSGWGDRPIYTSQDIEDFDAFREKCIQEQQIDKYVCQYDRLKQYFEE